MGQMELFENGPHRSRRRVTRPAWYYRRDRVAGGQEIGPAARGLRRTGGLLLPDASALCKELGAKLLQSSEAEARAWINQCQPGAHFKRKLTYNS